MLKKTLLVIASVLIAGCNTVSNTTLPVNPVIYNDYEAMASDGLPAYPVFVTFNNAYKGLHEENEAIARKDPKNPDKYFLKLIKATKKTLDVSFFDIDDPGAAKALIEAHKKGVKVRIVTDSDNMRDKDNPIEPRKVIEDMKEAGIPIRGDARSAFMHHKFMISDGQRVWVSSMNPTTTSMYHHNNNSVLIKSPELAANYQVEFNRNFSGQFTGKPPAVPNPSVTVSGITINTYFSPRGGTQAAILEELKNAKKSIKFMAFSFTEQQMGNTMVQKKEAGLKVEGIFDSCMINKYSQYSNLRNNKILSLRDGNQALLHHKTMIIDDETVITGSYNFSKSAEESNNENTIIIKSKIIAGHFNREYGRLKYAAFNNKNLPPYDHPACGGRSLNAE